MEFLVEMTTHVPAGTLDDTVADVRMHEAAHSRELARQGYLLRLWRPVRHPGEWRTLGLFVSDDTEALEKLLAAMPLRVWRTDQITPLSPHPNDPELVGITANHWQPTEFLIAMTVTVPNGTSKDIVANTMARETRRAHELARDGHLVRLWALPGQPDRRRTLGMWRAHDAASMAAILESLPLYGWMTIETTPLATHPNDPAGNQLKRHR